MTQGRSSWLQHLLVAIGAALPATVENVEDVRPGRVQLVGTLECATPLQAPVSGKPCAAFMYTARAAGSGRASTGARMRVLRRAMVYAPELRIALHGGSVPLVPPPGDDFDVEAHAALVALDLPGFRAREKRLAPGEPVRVLGKAVRTGETLAIHATAVAPAEG